MRPEALARLSCLFLLAAATLGLTEDVSAQQVRLQGYLIALQDCEANRRRDSDNPGNIRLEPMRAYEVIARNTTPGSHYLVRVPGAPQTQSRWVAMSCGAYAPEESLVVAGRAPGASLPGQGSADGGSPSGLAPNSIEYVLAASWQPGFCATAAGSDKAECRTQAPDRPDARQFSLHGLWPDDLDDTAIFPCYCGRGGPVSCRGSQEPDAAIDLSADVLAELEVAMPGVRSDLHLHEWAKHGSCYEDDRTGADAGADPDEYFREAMALLDQLNDSAVQTLFEEKLGEVVTRAEIEAAFDQAFGRGAGERVVVRCFQADGEDVITELWIVLKGRISDRSDFSELIGSAPPAATATDQRSCDRGRVVDVTRN